MKNETIYLKKWNSPIGDLFLYSDETHLLGLLFAGDATDFLRYFKNPEVVEKSTPVINETIQQLKEYFKGERKKFQLSLKPLGTEFQKKAWVELTKIPFGKTISYGDQAKNLNIGKAFRAVGSANGKNPIAIIIPCHRVIGSNGKISGYAGGVSMKAKLLALEGIVL